jgi:hypothetical protein
MRRALVLLTVALGLLGTLVVSASPAGAATTDSTSEAQFLRLLNLARAGSGRPMINLDATASNVARGWATSMANSGTLSHNPSYVSQINQFVTPDWTRVGENVGDGPSVTSLQSAFWNSPGHKANMLGDYNRVGIGAVRDGSGQIWVTYDFVKGPAIATNTGLSSCAATPAYMLDGFGAVHSVDGAPSLGNGPYWGWDIARDLAVVNGKGYVLDGQGAIHPMGGAAGFANGPYFSFDIAQAMAVTPDGKGAYVLDGWGGVHPAGTAKPAATTAYWVGWRIVRDLQVDPSTGDRGYVLDGFGGLHRFGNMPAARTTAYSSTDFAQSFRFLPNGTGGYVLDTAGHAHPFAVGNNPMPPSLPDMGAPIDGRASYLLLKGGSGAVVTGGGAVLGLSQSCATNPLWGTWNIVRGAATS